MHDERKPGTTPAELEALLELRTRQLDELSSAALSQQAAFLPIVRKGAHDVRSALSGILGLASLIEASLGSSPTDLKTTDRARLIGEAGQRLVQVADEMVDAARRNTGDDQTVRVSPAELLDRAVKALDPVPIKVGTAAGDALIIDAERVIAIIVDLALAFEPGSSPTVDISPDALSVAGDAPAGPCPVADYLAVTLGTKIARSDESVRTKLTMALDPGI